MILGSKGRSAIRNPDDVVDGIGDWAKDKKNPRMPTKPIKMNQYEPPCFQPGPDARKNYQGSDKDFEKEYHKQLKMQQDGINNMTVGEYLDNRRILQELTDQHGSEKARKILTQGQAKKLAREQADKQMEQLAALHNPDLIAGGKDEIGRMGNKGVNSSIGAQWPKQGRVTGMEDAAKSALEQFGPDAKMNVKLERCR